MNLKLAHVIEPEELTAETFAPFGTVMSLQASPRLPIDFYSGLNALHGPLVVDSDLTPEMLLFRVGLRGGGVRYLERHMEMAQAMIPLGGDPFIMVVAAPTTALQNGFPELRGIRAFHVPGDGMVQLHRGTWHEPPLPLKDGQMFLVTSNERLTRGLKEKLDENGEVHNHDVDKRNTKYRTDHSVSVRVPK